MPYLNRLRIRFGNGVVCSPQPKTKNGICIKRRFGSRIRNKRRWLRRHFENLSGRLAKLGLMTGKAQWKKEGHYVCRHGVFFKRAPAGGCPCLSATGTTDWTGASWMPSLDPELKMIIVQKFESSSFQRLGILQAQARRQDW